MLLLPAEAALQVELLCAVEYRPFDRLPHPYWCCNSLTLCLAQGELLDTMKRVGRFLLHRSLPADSLARGI